VAESTLQEKLQALWVRSAATERPKVAPTRPRNADFGLVVASPEPDLQARLQAAWPKPSIEADKTNGAITAPPPTLSTPISPVPAITAPQPVFIDIETQSLSEISVVGGRRYAYDNSTQLISLVAFIDEMVVVWIPSHELAIAPEKLWPEQISPRLPINVLSGPNLPQSLMAAIREGRPLCAHNAHGFDAHVWRAKGLPEPREWIDTLPMARAAGLPGGLEDLGLRLFDIGKDARGKEALKKITRPGKDGLLPAITPEQLTELVRYNIMDVALLVGVHTVVNGCGEPDVIQANLAINERGIAFDRELAAKLIELEAASLGPLCRAMEVGTGGAIQRADLNRVKHLRDWLAGKGVALDNLRRETVENALRINANLGPDIRAVLESRLANNRITTSKLKTAIAACGSEGRLRHQLVYHGAHTGRWSGRGMQPHNLPRPHRLLKDVGRLLPHVGNLDEFIGALPPGVSVADGVSALIRPCFTASPGHVFAIADFASIEARGVAWCADDQPHLALFAIGADSYCDLAAQIFGYKVTPDLKRERAIGKVAVLGCGYGLGADSFSNKCATDGVDLAAANTSATAVVEAYRDAYPKIAGVKNSQGLREGGLWRNLERAARLAIRGQGPIAAGKCTFDREGDDLVVKLPSGRRMYYRNARLEHERGPAGEDSTAGIGTGRKTVMFDSPTIKNVTTYGGKLTENIVSAICRDLLAAALVQCEREGLAVVLHVHDEIVLEVPSAIAGAALCRLLTIMSMPPCWANGFPIEVEGFTAGRYFKTPPNDSTVLRARQGEILSQTSPAVHNDLVAAHSRK
jgi:DNA polymerase